MSVRFRSISTILAVAVAMTAFTACQTKARTTKIAVALPLTGDIASLGQGLKRAIEMAVAEYNAAGPKTPVELVSFDDRSDPKEAVSVANRIVSDPSVIGVLGHFNSGCSIPASRIYAQAGLPMISPASSDPELTLQQLSPQWTFKKTIFRVNTTDNVQGAGRRGLRDRRAEGEADCRHPRQDGLWPGRRRGIPQTRAPSSGAEVVAFEGLQVGDRDFRSLLTRIKALSPDALYFGGMFSEGGILVRQARDIGFKGAFIGSEANYDPSFIRVAGDAAEGAYVTFLGSPADLLDSARDFVERYHQRYPNEEVKSYDHYGYEVASILLEALTQVGPDRDKILTYVRGINHSGVLGQTAFDEKGDTLNKTITLFRVEKGKFVPVPSKKA